MISSAALQARANIDELTIFKFEMDFVGSLRCIPMAVRFKLDHCGIKLSLRQWSRFNYDDRLLLFRAACATPREILQYRSMLIALIEARTGEAAKLIAIETAPAWGDIRHVPGEVVHYARSQGLVPPSIGQWASLSNLQRFALVKLTREGHDNLNFMPAMQEFGIVLADRMSA